MNTWVKRDQRGLGILEVIIGLALIAILFFGVSTAITYFRKSAKKLEGSPQCVARLKEIMLPFESNNDSQNILNWHQTVSKNDVYFDPPRTAPLVDPSSPHSFINAQDPSIYPSFPILYDLKTGAPVKRESYVGKENVNSWILIDNSLGLATSLYNAGAMKYCNPQNKFEQSVSEGRTDFGSNYIDPSDKKYGFVHKQASKILKDEKLYVNVQKKTFGTTGGNLSCDPNFRISFPPTGVSSNPNSAAGLTATFKIRYLDESGNPAYCEDSVEMRSAVDRIAPKLVRPKEIVPSFSITSPGEPDILIGGNIQPKSDGRNSYYCKSNSYVEIGVAFDEPATVLLCRLTFANPNAQSKAPGKALDSAPFQPCFGFKAEGIGVSGRITDYAKKIRNQTEVKIVIGNNGDGYMTENMREGFYTLSIKAVDAARNESQVHHVSFGVDISRPGDFQVVPPNLLLSSFSKSISARGHQVVPEVYKDKIHFQYKDSNLGFTVTDLDVHKPEEEALYQCEAPVATDVWQTQFLGENTVSPEGAVWNVDVENGKNDSNCTSAFNHPSSLGEGVHTVTARSCDLCHSAPTARGQQDFEINRKTTKRMQWRVDTLDLNQLGLKQKASSDKTIDLKAGVDIAYELDPKPAHFRSPDNESPKYILSPVQKPLGKNLVKWACPVGSSSFENDLDPSASITRNQNLATNQTVCIPKVSLTPACGIGGSKGFSAKGFDGCGRQKLAEGSKYFQRLASEGENCSYVQCQPNLVCAVDGLKPNTCIKKIPCSSDASCSNGHRCYLEFPHKWEPCNIKSGVCGGGNIGPSIGGASGGCPDLAQALDGVAMKGHPGYQRFYTHLCGSTPTPTPAPSATPGPSPTPAAAAGIPFSIVGVYGGPDLVVDNLLNNSSSPIPLKVKLTDVKSYKKYTVRILQGSQRCFLELPSTLAQDLEFDLQDNCLLVANQNYTVVAEERPLANPTAPPILATNSPFAFSVGAPFCSGSNDPNCGICTFKVGQYVGASGSNLERVPSRDKSICMTQASCNLLSMYTRPASQGGYTGVGCLGGVFDTPGATCTPSTDRSLVFVSNSSDPQIFSEVCGNTLANRMTDAQIQSAIQSLVTQGRCGPQGLEPACKSPWP